MDANAGLSLDEALQQILVVQRPEVAEALRACALVHWFDGPLIGELRGEARHADKIFRRLSQFTFVEPVSPERFSLHENIRESLLGDWKGDPEGSRQIHMRAYQAFSSRLEANPQDETLQIESLYHLLAFESERGLRAFERVFDEAEESFRLEVADRLLAVLEEQTDSLYQPWHTFFKARLSLARGQVKACLEALNELGQTALPERLHAQVIFYQGKAELESSNWPEAIRRLEEGVAALEDLGETKLQTKALIAQARAYSQFALNLRPDYRKQAGGNFLGDILTSLTLGSVFFSVYLYLWLKFPLRSPLRLPHPITFQPVFMDIFTTYLLGQALSCYRRAGRMSNDILVDFEIQFGLAEILQKFNNLYAANRIYKKLVKHPALEDRELPRAILHKEIARTALMGGDRKRAKKQLAACLPVLERYRDEVSLAEAYALQAQILHKEQGAASALEDYETSIRIYQRRGLRLPLGKLIYEIEKLEKKPGLLFWKKPKKSVLEETSLRTEDRVFFSPRGFRVYQSIEQILMILFLLGGGYFILQYLIDVTTAFTLSNQPLFQIGLFVFSMIVSLNLYFILTGVVMRRFVRLENLDNFSPRFISVSRMGITFSHMDGALLHQIPMDSITGISTKEWWLWTRSMASSRLEIFWQGEQEEISASTLQYVQLKRIIRNYLQEVRGGEVAWREESISLLRSPRGILYIFLILVAMVAAIITFTFILSYINLPGFLIDDPIPLLFWIPIVILGAASWDLLSYLGRLQARIPRAPIAYGLLILSILVLWGYFQARIVQEIGRPMSLLAIGLALWWLVQASYWIARPRYLVPAPEPRSPRILGGIRRGLAALIMILGLFLAYRFLSVDVREYYHLAAGYLSYTFEINGSTEEHLNKSIDLMPGDPWPYFWRASNFQRGFQYESALADYDFLNQNFAGKFDLEEEIISLLIKVGRVDQARREIAVWEIVQNQEQEIVAWEIPENNRMARGRLYMLLGDYGNALLDVEAAYTSNPEASSYVYTYAAVLEALSRHKEALDILRNYEPETSREFFNRAKGFYEIRRFDLAIQDWEINDSTGYIVRRAQALLASADNEGLQALQEKYSSAVRPESRLDPYLALAGLLDLEAGLSALNDEIADDATDFRALYYRGQIFQALGRSEAAISDYERVLRERDYDDLAAWEVRTIEMSLKDLRGE